MNPVIKRLRQASKDRTHWKGCEESHLLCASAKEIKRLEDVINILTKALNAHIEHNAKKK